ncbi:hypothetical protein [Lyngbya aestuarii]|uniref:hypothetical protein n=1 Tax=Lyngbya aestuarii TaxID=118322 RepID=UPI00403DFECB
MKISQLAIGKSDQDWHLNLESPFSEKNGLLEFKAEFNQPEFLANWSFRTNLYGEQVRLDHFVMTLPSPRLLKKYAKTLGKFGGQIIEGLGLFPQEFCADTYQINADLWMHLMTILMPSGGLVVIDAPHSTGDQKSRFIEERGKAAVHHVAIRVEDVQTTAWFWRKKGFEPMSKFPFSGDSLCQWFLQNSAGQIIELVKRHPNNYATFECQNIGGLRLSEVV